MCFRVAAALSGLVLTVAARPCAMLSSGAEVRLTGEKALIAFDQVRSIEHFVRTAEFASEAKDFGFLIPVPSKPTVAEVDDECLPDLADFIRPFLTVPRPLGQVNGARGGGSGSGGVQVIETVPVGPFTASVLRSADAGALDRWLKVNGYKMKPDIARYLGPYTARHWFFVALKVTSEQSSVRSATLRVSFATKRPIYPYRTPVSQWGGHDRRPLSLFFLSSFRPQASFVNDGRAWLSPVCETEFDGVPLETLARQLKLRPDSLPGQAVLSLFRTEGEPADYADDLRFSSDPLLGF